MGAGIEKIKEQAKELKDKNIQKVAEYLINREDMDEKYLQKDKNLSDMWKFITEEAKKKAKDGCAVLEDEEVYGLAIHYFDESNKQLGIKTKSKKEDAKEEKNVSNTEQDASVQEEQSTEVVKNVEKAEENPKQNDNDIVFKWKGREVTKAQFNSKEYLSW